MAASTTTRKFSGKPGYDDWNRAIDFRRRIRTLLQPYSDSKSAPAPDHSTKEVRLEDFEQADALFANYRLACVGAIWTDIRTATEKSMEEIMWGDLIFFDKACAKAMVLLEQDPGPNRRPFLKRKLDKIHRTFLKVSQQFYEGYLQRVVARYKVQSHVFRRLEVDVVGAMKVPAAAQIDAQADGIQYLVIKSCHRTLICLGDLARIRNELRRDQRDWNPALTFYKVANDLVPESGSGHRQCGVIYYRERDDLNAIYHLYRTVYCDQLAQKSSAKGSQKLSEILQVVSKPGSGSKRTMKGHEPLEEWFLRLHAGLYQGEEFLAREELEKEVTSRLDKCFRSQHNLAVETGLVRMILINMCAYENGVHEWEDLASQRAETKQSSAEEDKKSWSCHQFLLLNMRTIKTIAEIILEEAGLANADALSDPASTKKESQDVRSEEHIAKFPRRLQNLLRCFRLYMIWLHAYRSRFRVYEGKPTFEDMSQVLNQMLSCLRNLVVMRGEGCQLANALFTQDDEARGIKYLDGEGLSRKIWLPWTSVPMEREEDGEKAGVDFSENDVAFTRLCEILVCGESLAQTGFSRQVSGGELLPGWRLTGPAEGRQQSQQSPASPTVVVSSNMASINGSSGSHLSRDDNTGRPTSQAASHATRGHESARGLAGYGQQFLSSNLHPGYSGTEPSGEASKSPRYAPLPPPRSTQPPAVSPTHHESSYSTTPGLTNDPFGMTHRPRKSWPSPGVGLDAVSAKQTRAYRPAPIGPPSKTGNGTGSGSVSAVAGVTESDAGKGLDSGSTLADLLTSSSVWANSSLGAGFGPTDISRRSHRPNSSETAASALGTGQRLGRQADDAHFAGIWNTGNPWHKEPQDLALGGGAHAGLTQQQDWNQQQDHHRRLGYRNIAEAALPVSHQHTPNAAASFWTPSSCSRPFFAAPDPSFSNMVLSASSSGLSPVHSPQGLPRRAMPAPRDSNFSSTGLHLYSPVRGAMHEARPLAGNAGMYNCNGRSYGATTAFGRNDPRDASEGDRVNYSVTLRALQPQLDEHNRQTLLSALDSRAWPQARPKQ